MGVDFRDNLFAHGLSPGRLLKLNVWPGQVAGHEVSHARMRPLDSGLNSIRFSKSLINLRPNECEQKEIRMYLN